MKLTDKELREAAIALLLLRGTPPDQINTGNLESALEEIRRHELIHEAMETGKLVAKAHEAKAREQEE